MPLPYIVACLLVNVVLSASEDHAYCAVRYARLCQEKGQHVGCQYPDSGPGDSCERYSKIVFTEDLKNFILNYINRRRQKIAAGHEKVRGGQPIPKPDIMMYVEWDRELAHLAQRLADQCRFVHDECRATVRYPYAGQTVGEVRWRKSQDSELITAQKAIRKVLDAWWGEKRRVQPQQLTTPFRVTQKGIVWGHFSQLANWKLRAIGCGAVHHGPPHPRLLLVCDYSHTNMLGQKTISAGPLATCPSHTTRMPRSQFPLLCTTIKYPLKSQEFEPVYDNNEDLSEEKEQTIAEGEEKQDNTVATDDELYKDKAQQDIDENLMSTRFSSRRISTALHGLEREVKLRKQVQIKYGHYAPSKATPRQFESTEYYTSKDADHGRGRNSHGGHFYEKRPHESEDFSVIPLRSQVSDSSNELEPEAWRPPPKLFWRTTTDQPQYETSIVFIPLYKNRRVTEPVPSTEVMLTARRQHYKKDNRGQSSQTKAIERETTHSIRKPSDPSLMLDKEDIDQLFKDTGFKPNWTPKV